jgi:hypothetical protein
MSVKKTLIASGMALAMGASGSAYAAFTALADGAYTMTITSGCFNFGACTTAGGPGTIVDNTAGQTTVTAAGGPTPGTWGSGIAGDSVMGVMNFTMTGGTMSVTSYSQDSYLATAGGTFALDVVGGTGSMTGAIDGSGGMNFTPTNRYGIAGSFATTLGHLPWNQNTVANPTIGAWAAFTTGTSTNLNKGTTAAYSQTGSALVDAGAGMWTGTLVSVGNIGSTWGAFNKTQYTELWDIKITAAAVPVPAAVWMFGSGLLGLVGVARRRKRA